MYNYIALLRLLLVLMLLSQLQSCAARKWYSIQQENAEPVAYLSDGVFVSGEYVRSASVTEIDGNTIQNSADNKLKIALGVHTVKIYCDEAKGSFDSNKLSGQAKVLKFEAHTQRSYKVFCLPYTHWWIKDIESGKIVAGRTPAI